MHEDVTPLFLVQEELRQKSEKLEEVNVALKVLLEQRMTANSHELVLPYTEKLKNVLESLREKTLIDIVENNLNDIIAPFLNRLSSINLLLTPQEVEVAALIRTGKSSQEIADVLGMSVSTISFHRKNLRRKLALHERTMNLRTYLLSLK